MAAAVRAAAGSAVLTVPGFLTGCGVQQATAVAEPTPENPFMDWFGVDQATVARVMSELTANGADAADLYFQHSRNNSLALEDGIVSSADSTIQQGVGLRVVIGEQTGYAFTEDLTLPSMLAAGLVTSRVRALTRPGLRVAAGVLVLLLGVGSLGTLAMRASGGGHVGHQADAPTTVQQHGH